MITIMRKDYRGYYEKCVNNKFEDKKKVGRRGYKEGGYGGFKAPPLVFRFLKYFKNYFIIQFIYTKVKRLEEMQ